MKLIVFFANCSMFLLLLGLPAQCAIHPIWRLVMPEELALKQSKIDPQADAEALLREVWIDPHSTTTYVCLKIFTERGRDKYSSVKLEYWGRFHISDVRARTIHPDGQIVELSQDSILDQLELQTKRKNIKVKVLSFALPSVQVGSIIEYSWTENDRPTAATYFPLEVQSEYPVDEAVFHIAELTRDSPFDPTLKLMAFACQYKRSTYELYKGFSTITVRDIPAYYDEPFSPPKLAERKWILAFYAESPFLSGGDFWTSIGKIAYEQVEKRTKTGKELEHVAAEVIKNGKTDEEKIALLADYCRKNIKDIDGSNITTEANERYKPNKNASDTLRNGAGTAEDIDFTFIAMAKAAGYDAGMALVADRKDFFFAPNLQSSFFLNNYDAAVRIDGKWKFYDVADEWAPPGRLSWREQGVYALIPGPEKSDWVKTPLLPAGDSKIQRLAALTLTNERELEGEIRELYWGNESFRFRKEHARETESEREDFVRNKLKQAFPDFEVDRIHVTISPDASQPAGVSYRMRVKGYAQRTGRRLFLRPSFFRTDEGAYFPSSERHNRIYFDYPWQEWDSVTIQLPEDLELEQAESPASFHFPPTGEYDAKLDLNPQTRTLTYERFLKVGSDQIPLFDAHNYPTLKGIFDRIHAADQHLLVLKAQEPAATAQR